MKARLLSAAILGLVLVVGMACFLLHVITMQVRDQIGLVESSRTISDFKEREGRYPTAEEVGLLLGPAMRDNWGHVIHYRIIRDAEGVDHFVLVAAGRDGRMDEEPTRSIATRNRNVAGQWNMDIIAHDGRIVQHAK